MKLDLRTERLKDVRRQRLVPGVMYGKSIESTSVQTEDQEIKEAIKTYGKTQVFKVRVDGKYHHVYIKNVQTNILKPHEIIHFDLHRVTPKEQITAQIPVELVGVEAFYQKKVYPELVLNEIQATYTPGSGIQSFKIDVSKLDLNDVIHVKDIEVPKGIEIKTDLKQVVAVMKEVRVEAEPVEETESTLDTEVDTDESIENIEA